MLLQLCKSQKYGEQKLLNKLVTQGGKVCHFLHSPSNHRQPEFNCKVLDLCRWQGFGKRVCNHVFGWVVD
jgi:hypothetical protein